MPAASSARKSTSSATISIAAYGGSPSWLDLVAAFRKGSRISSAKAAKDLEQILCHAMDFIMHAWLGYCQHRHLARR